MRASHNPGVPVRGRDRALPAIHRELVSWWIYDWANSAFGTLITTFIFAAYFASAVVPDPTQATVLWGRTSSIAAMIVAVLSPILGAIADQGGKRKTWLFVTTSGCVVMSALLYFVAPSSEHIAFALIVFAGAVVFSELSLVFYNSMLPGLALPSRVALVSGWGLGIGFIGGVAALMAALFLLVGEGALLAGLDKGGAENIRATALLVALWYAAFAMPLFLFTSQRAVPEKSPREAVTSGLAVLARTFRETRKHANIMRYLIAYLFYANGVSTLFAFGGIYAVGEFGLSAAELTRFAIALNIAAGFGAAGLSWTDVWLGPKRAIFVALTGLIISGGVLVLTESTSVLWALGIVLGALIGMGQALSRAFLARLAPPSMEAQMFGLYALSGKATAFAGPLILALVTDAFDSQRAGMATVLVFFAIGLVLLLPVREPSLHPAEGH